MTKRQWKQVLNYHLEGLVNLALSYVNLNDKDKLVIDLCARQCMTHEQAAEHLGCDVKTVKRMEDRVYHKCVKVWSGLRFVCEHMISDPP